MWPTPLREDREGMVSDATTVSRQHQYDALRDVTVRLRDLADELGPHSPERTELRRQRAVLFIELGHLDLAALEYARCVLAEPDDELLRSEYAALRARLESGS
jgi:hypothetical protein